MNENNDHTAWYEAVRKGLKKSWVPSGVQDVVEMENKCRRALMTPEQCVKYIETHFEW